MEQPLQTEGVAKEPAVLHRLQVKQHYTPISEFLDVEDPVWKAWRSMKDKEVKLLPVVKSGRVVGVVSDRDIVQISGYNGGQSMPVKEAMSLDPLLIRLDDSLDQVLKAMLRKDQQFAIVVGDGGTICGLFSWACAFKFFLNFSDIDHLRQLLSS